MIRNDTPDTWSPEDEADFDQFQENVYYMLRTLLSCCLVRNLSRSEEVNSAVDILLLGWLYSSFHLNHPTDIDYVSSMTAIYKKMKEDSDQQEASQAVSIIRKQVETDEGMQELHDVANTVDFSFAELQKGRCGHSWRERLSGATVDVVLHAVSTDISPAEIEAAMLVFVLYEKPLAPIPFGEFVVSRFRSRVDAYKEAIEELQVRISSPMWN